MIFWTLAPILSWETPIKTIQAANEDELKLIMTFIKNAYGIQCYGVNLESGLIHFVHGIPK